MAPEKDNDASLWHNFAEEVIGNPTNSDVSTQSNKSVKRRKRECGGVVLMREHIEKVHEILYEIVGLIKQEIGGDIWCHAMLMFRDPSNREIFFEMPSGDARLAWLKFAHTRNAI